MADNSGSGSSAAFSVYEITTLATSIVAVMSGFACALIILIRKRGLLKDPYWFGILAFGAGVSWWVMKETIVEVNIAKPLSVSTWVGLWLAYVAEMLLTLEHKKTFVCLLLVGGLVCTIVCAASIVMPASNEKQDAMSRLAWLALKTGPCVFTIWTWLLHLVFERHSRRPNPERSNPDTELGNMGANTPHAGQDPTGQQPDEPTRGRS